MSRCSYVRVPKPPNFKPKTTLTDFDCAIRSQTNRTEFNKEWWIVCLNVVYAKDRSWCGFRVVTITMSAFHHHTIFKFQATGLTNSFVMACTGKEPLFLVPTVHTASDQSELRILNVDGWRTDLRNEGWHHFRDTEELLQVQIPWRVQEKREDQRKLRRQTQHQDLWHLHSYTLL